MAEATGYQFPPQPPETAPAVAERIRATEDYLSRITETFVYRSTSLTVASSDALTIVSFTHALSNTAALWSAGTDLIVPAGSEGDYVVRARIQAPPQVSSGNPPLITDTGDVVGAILLNGLEVAVSQRVKDGAIAVWSTHIGLARGSVLRLGIFNPQTDSDVVPGGSNTLYLHARRVV